MSRLGFLPIPCFLGFWLLVPGFPYPFSSPRFQKSISRFPFPVSHLSLPNHRGTAPITYPPPIAPSLPRSFPSSAPRSLTHSTARHFSTQTATQTPTQPTKETTTIRTNPTLPSNFVKFSAPHTPPSTLQCSSNGNPTTTTTTTNHQSSKTQSQPAPRALERSPLGPLAPLLRRDVQVGWGERVLG